MTDPAWPGFLDELDRNPDNVQIEFYKFTRAVLELNPPKYMRYLVSDEQEDVFSETFLFCIKDDFAILRTYINKGKPFAGWFYTILNNKVIDFLRAKSRKPEVNPVNPDHGNDDFLDFQPAPNPDPVKIIEFKRILATTNEAIKQLSENCQLLLTLASDGLRPREIVKILRFNPDKNKKVSDDLRECRRKLRKLLADKGVNLKEYLSK